MICDFCSTPNPTRKIDCAPFIMSEVGNIVHWSDGAWAACDKCAALIDANKWDELIDRVVRTLPMSLRPFQEREYRQYLASVYEKFRVAKGQVA